MVDAGVRPFNPTGLEIDLLKRIGEACLKVPDDFRIHSNVVKLFDGRRYDHVHNMCFHMLKI